MTGSTILFPQSILPAASVRCLASAVACPPVHYVFRSNVSLHSFRLNLCSVKYIVQCGSSGQWPVHHCGSSGMSTRVTAVACPPEWQQWPVHQSGSSGLSTRVAAVACPSVWQQCFPEAGSWSSWLLMTRPPPSSLRAAGSLTWPRPVQDGGWARREPGARRETSGRQPGTQALGTHGHSTARGQVSQGEGHS